MAGEPASTSAPAYDDLERFAYARHRTLSPYTVLELLAAGSSGASDYHAAGAAFQRWLRTGVLRLDPEPAFYRYEEHELRQGVPAVQRGVLAAVRVGDGTVLAHERVDPRRVADRVRRLEAVPADLAPVFTVYPWAPDRLRELLDRPPRTPPIVAFTDDAGVDHRVWAVRDAAEVDAIRQGFARVRVVIADGHHRYAAALARTPARESRTLTYLVDGERHGPQVLPVHRLVAPLPQDVELRLRDHFRLTAAPADPVRLQQRLAATPGRAFGLRLPGGRGLLLTVTDEAALQARLPPDRSPVWRGLDTAVLEHAVLPGLGGGAVTYRSDPEAAAAEVDAHGAAGLFLVGPVTVATVYACAAAGEPMPAKTTWFRPKPRAGLIMRCLQSAGDSAAAPDREDAS